MRPVLLRLLASSLLLVGMGCASTPARPAARAAPTGAALLDVLKPPPFWRSSSVDAHTVRWAAGDDGAEVLAGIAPQSGEPVEAWVESGCEASVRNSTFTIAGVVVRAGEVGGAHCFRADAGTWPASGLFVVARFRSPEAALQASFVLGSLVLRGTRASAREELDPRFFGLTAADEAQRACREAASHVAEFTDAGFREAEQHARRAWFFDGGECALASLVEAFAGRAFLDRLQGLPSSPLLPRALAVAARLPANGRDAARARALVELAQASSSYAVLGLIDQSQRLSAATPAPASTMPDAGPPSELAAALARIYYGWTYGVVQIPPSAEDQLAFCRQAQDANVLPMPGAALCMAHALVALDRIAEAEAVLEQIAAAARDPAALVVVARALTAKGDLDAAERHLTQAARLRDDSAPVHGALGELYLARAQNDLAARHFERALRLRPDWHQNRVRTAFAYLRGGDTLRTSTLLEEVLGTDPCNVLALRLRAELRRNTGDIAGAATDLAHAMYQLDQSTAQLAEASAALRQLVAEKPVLKYDIRLLEPRTCEPQVSDQLTANAK